MNRIHWDEKAKRLAQQYDLYDEVMCYLEIRLEQPNGIRKMGIVTEDNRVIFWYLKNGWIYCDVDVYEKLLVKGK